MYDGALIWFDWGSSLGLFIFFLSHVCRLMVAIYIGCISHKVKKRSIDLLTSESYNGYMVMISCKKFCVLGLATEVWLLEIGGIPDIPPRNHTIRNVKQSNVSKQLK